MDTVPFIRYKNTTDWFSKYTIIRAKFPDSCGILCINAIALQGHPCTLDKPLYNLGTF